MDSGLINVLPDDPFDGNYGIYNSLPSFWSTASDSMDMQLSDSLDNILPIMGTDDANAIFGNSLIRDHDEGSAQKNTLIYNGFAEQDLEHLDNIEILTVDPEAIDCDTDDDISNDENDLVENDNSDAESLCSNGTFRSRTDSSSIGDYESHSSDYDDYVEEQECTEEEGNHTQNSAIYGLSENILPTNNSTLDTSFKLPLLASARKQRTFSTNTNISDIDGLGIPIDYNTFDLAEFITKDDFKIQNKTPTKKTVTQAPTKSIVYPAHTKHMSLGNGKSMNYDESDSDSDTIVDVETVEVEEPLWSEQKDAVEPTNTEDDIVFEDNVKIDPSWCPKQKKKAELNAKEAKAVTQTILPLPEKSTKEKNKRGICLVPSKKQREFLKRKIGSKSTLTTSPTKVNMKATKKAVAKKAKDVPSKASGKVQPSNTTSKPIGKSQGGKNLAILQQLERRSNPPTKTPEDKSPVIEKEQNTTSMPSVPTISSIPAPIVKRKLNLEEYKKRRGATQTSTNSSSPSKQQKLDNVAPRKALSNCVQSALPTVTAPQKTSPSKHNSAISEIVQTLKAPVQPKPMTDPITEAKNKVLRMQQIKRARQLKILDSAVSAKVPRVTKLPPLKDLVKGTYCLTGDKDTACSSSVKLSPEYEEITVVSASCNTDISIPPINERKELRKYSSRSLLKSSALLNNASVSFPRVQPSNDNPKILTSSLIASIQSEVVKKSQSINVRASSTSAAKVEHHGEDRTIMYLSKNRDRKHTESMGIQTELLPEFPMLTLLKRPHAHKSRERTRHKSRAYRKRNTSRSSSASTAASCGDGESIVSPMRSLRSGSDCCSNASTERMRNSDATAAGSYSSRSTRRHRSSVSSSSCSEQENYERSRRQRRTSYNKRRSKNYSRSDSITSTSSESDYVQSRARSRSPLYRRSRSRSRSHSQRKNYNSSNHNKPPRTFVDHNVPQPAVEERRIVYVGRIEQETTKDMLRRKFLRYGTIKTISIHLKETGMKYGFVTFERAQDAFTAIDSSARDAQINMYDISFGGRRAFCRASYADLDSAGINNYHSYVYPKAAAAVKEDDSFEAMLLKVKAKLNANKSAASVANSSENTKDSNNQSKI